MTMPIAITLSGGNSQVAVRIVAKKQQNVNFLLHFYNCGCALSRHLDNPIPEVPASELSFGWQHVLSTHNRNLGVLHAKENHRSGNRLCTGSTCSIR
jgi:hypothetical protein